MKKVQFLKKTVSSCQKQSAKPPGSNSSHRLRFVLELRYSLSNAKKPCKVLSDSISDAGDGAVGIGLCNEFEIESSVNFGSVEI